MCGVFFIDIVLEITRSISKQILHTGLASAR